MAMHFTIAYRESPPGRYVADCSCSWKSGVYKDMHHLRVDVDKHVMFHEGQPPVPVLPLEARVAALEAWRGRVEVLERRWRRAVMDELKLL
jgi:Ni,Fe-hydrogenase III small subunit